MNNIETPAGDPGRGSRIEQAVAREIGRSRNLLWLFSLLLVIPVGASIVYYQYGRTDVALVQSEVNNQLAPVRQIVEQTKPALEQVRQTVEQISAQRVQLESLRQQQEVLATTVQAVPDRLKQVDAIRTDLSGVKQEIEVASDRVAQLDRRFSAVERLQKGAERDVKDLSARLDKIRPVSNDDQLRRQQELIESLKKRIDKLEQPTRANPRTERPR